jgi:hypothetical protein
MRRRIRLNTFRRLPRPLIAAFVKAGATVVFGPGRVGLRSEDVQIASSGCNLFQPSAPVGVDPSIPRISAQANPSFAGPVQLPAFGEHQPRGSHDHAARQAAHEGLGGGSEPESRLVVLFG